MGPLGPGHIGGCRPGAARSAGFRKVSAGRPWGCVGDVEGIMNGGVAIAFLPKFAGFPSLRGLHSSIVQPRRALVRGRRAPVRRVSRPEPGRTGARNSGRSRKGSQSRAVTDATPGRAEVVLQAGNAARIPRSRPTGVRPVIRPGSPEHDNAGPAPRCGPRLQWIRPPRGEDSGPSPAVRMRTSVSCLRRRSHRRHPRRTTRLRRTSRRRRSVPRGVPRGVRRRMSRSLPRRPTSCCCCCRSNRRTPTPRGAPSVRKSPCGHWRPAPRPGRLRPPPG